MFTKKQYRVLFLFAGTTVLLSTLISGLTVTLLRSGNPGQNGMTINVTDVILEEEYDEAIVIENSQAYAEDLVDEGYLGIDTIEAFRKIGRDADYPADENYVLLNNLDFESFTWTDDVSDPFIGIFDGAGFTLSNLTYTSETTGFGLFHLIGKDETFDPTEPAKSAILRNFTITNFDIDAFDRVGLLAANTDFLVEVESVEILDSFIKSITSEVGAFFGSSDLVSFKHSIVQNSIITTESTLDIGGFVGYSESALIENSHSIGNEIYGISSVGGLLGYSRGFSIYASSNQSLVIGQQDGIGGLVGATNTYKGSILKDSFNSGTVISRRIDPNISGNNVGGLIGLFDSASYGYGIMENVSNFGNIYSNNNNLGGLVGDLETDQMFVNQAFNQGNVMSIGEDASNIGGIFGDISNHNHLKLINIYNVGDVVGKENVGGLFGYSSGGDEYGYFQNLYNAGTVSGINRIGGLFGNVNGGESNYMVNVFNAGELINLTPENNILPGHIVGYFNDDMIVHNAYFFWDGISPYRFAVSDNQSSANVFLARVITDLNRFNDEDDFIFRDVWNFEHVWTFPTSGENTFPVFIHQTEIATTQIDPTTIDYSIFRLTDPA